MPTPTVALGMTVFNPGSLLRPALDSLLAQTRRDFILVVLDDGTSDGSYDVLRVYARRDARIRLFRHETNHGLICAWKSVYFYAKQELPGMRYFAWVSDHDFWEPEWLKRHVEVLDREPMAVLAYPIAGYLGGNGQEIGRTGPRFETAGIRDVFHRFRYTCRSIYGAGNMIYGLFRPAALDAAGVFRPILLPDRFLLLEASLQGTFHQIPEILWRRRMIETMSLQRQRDRLFGPAGSPAYTWLPWWSVFGFLFFRYYVLMTPEKLRRHRSRLGLHLFYLIASQIFRDFYKMTPLRVRSWMRKTLEKSTMGQRFIRKYYSRRVQSEDRSVTLASGEFNQ